MRYKNILTVIASSVLVLVGCHGSPESLSSPEVFATPEVDDRLDELTRDELESLVEEYERQEDMEQEYMDYRRELYEDAEYCIGPMCY